MTPVDPPKKAMGMNTAESTSAMPTSAPVICLMDLRVASFGESPSSLITRSTFSTTTMASSTSNPMASTSPEHGDRIDGKTAGGHYPESAEQYDGHRDRWNQRRPEILQKEKHHEENKSPIASTSVFTTSWMDILTKGVVS